MAMIMSSMLMRTHIMVLLVIMRDWRMRLMARMVMMRSLAGLIGFDLTGFGMIMSRTGLRRTSRAALLKALIITQCRLIRQSTVCLGSMG